MRSLEWEEEKALEGLGTAGDGGGSIEWQERPDYFLPGETPLPARPSDLADVK